MKESIRPKGTVEVTCSYSGCNWSWWLDPLDSLLPDGPFDCGRDHKAEQFVDQQLSRLQLETGIHWGTRRNEAYGKSKEPSPEKGVAMVHNRTRTSQGVLRWNQLHALNHVSNMVRYIQWGTTAVQENFGDTECSPSCWEVTEDTITWANYKLNGLTRRFTMVPCSRCQRNVAVDLYDHHVNLSNSALSVGGYGKGVVAKPSWWGKAEIFCEDGLWGRDPQPCKLIYGSTVREFEAATGAFWTMFTPNAALFYEPTLNRYGTLKCHEDYFRSSEVLGRNLFLGDLVRVRDYLETMVGKEDLIYQEVSKHAQR